jgi:excisionase family DNA binding protein
VAEAAVALGVSEAVIRRLIASNELPSLRLGKRLLVPASALRDLIEPTQSPLPNEVAETPLADPDPDSVRPDPQTGSASSFGLLTAAEDDVDAEGRQVARAKDRGRGAAPVPSVAQAISDDPMLPWIAKCILRSLYRNARRVAETYRVWTDDL